MLRALNGGFQGSKRHAKQEFLQLPTSLAVHSRLTRSPGQTQLVFVVCIVQDELWET